MKVYHSLKKTGEFLRVYRQGEHKRNSFLVFFKIENGLGYSRFGVSASKKVGNSVQRHRMARMSRAAFRVFDEGRDDSYDYVISWKKFDPDLKSADLLEMIEKLNEKCCH